MNICDNGHDEIAHNETMNSCPICALISDHDDEIGRLEERIGSLMDEVDTLEKDVTSLENDITALEADIADMQLTEIE